MSAVPFWHAAMVESQFLNPVDIKCWCTCVYQQYRWEIARRLFHQQRHLPVSAAETSESIHGPCSQSWPFFDLSQYVVAHLEFASALLEIAVRQNWMLNCRLPGQSVLLLQSRYLQTCDSFLFVLFLDTTSVGKWNYFGFHSGRGHAQWWSSSIEHRWRPMGFC